MDTLRKRDFYRRKLPHYHLPGHDYFITTRLIGSLPKDKRPDFQNFAELEKALHHGGHGPFWLAQPEIAKIVMDAILFRDQKVFVLHSACIMPNHLHLVFRHLVSVEADLQCLKRDSISGIMHSLKSFTSNKCNKVLGRSGHFWENEYFDRLIRDQSEWEKTIYYVLNNPVKAGLVQSWRDWPWTYCKYSMT